MDILNRSRWLGVMVALSTALLTIGQSKAAEGPGLTPLTIDCLYNAADAFNHQPLSLILILAQESGKVGKCSPPNENGSVDCGPAQINSNEIRKLAPKLGWSQEETFRRVRDDGCFNIYVSAYILALKKIDASGNMWDAMGRYNSATPGLKEKYQKQLRDQYKKFAQDLR